jgi:hypothetical protein
MSIRLNDSIRSAFVNSVLQDTPKVDHMEQRRKVIQDHLFAIAPASVMRMYKDKATQIYFRPDHVCYESENNSRYSWGLGKFWLVPDTDGGSTTYKITDKDVVLALRKIDADEIAQSKVLGSLETKLYATIRSFNTVKQARDAMPEFAKYLPEDADPKCKTLPAITDLVTDLMKAGWPDGGKKNDKAKAKAA